MLQIRDGEMGEKFIRNGMESRIVNSSYIYPYVHTTLCPQRPSHKVGRYQRIL